MPFDAAFTDVYEQLIRTPLEAAGFLVRRADSLFNQQQILKDVVKGIADATLVIADVTGLNENVLYELGLAHALGKRTVMITQKLDDLPFDLRAYRANEYSMLFHKAGELKDLLAKVGEAVLRGKRISATPSRTLLHTPFVVLPNRQSCPWPEDQATRAATPRTSTAHPTTMSRVSWNIASRWSWEVQRSCR
jgi:hypothetical protein